MKKIIKKKATQKTVKKAVKKVAKPKVPKTLLGHVTHYYGGIGVAIIKLVQPIERGVCIRVFGATTNFEQPLESMQLEHVDIVRAQKGAEIGIKTKDRVREGDEVHRKVESRK